MALKWRWVELWRWDLGQRLLWVQACGSVLRSVLEFRSVRALAMALVCSWGC